MADSSNSPPPRPPLDPYKFLGIAPNPDGTLTRLPRLPTVPPSSSPSSPCLSKDVPLDPANGTFLRIFRPNPLPAHRGPVPVLINFHGGGFVLFSAASAPFHDACAALAVRLPAVVVAVEYRLAPGHRLPAAYRDALAAVRWVARRAALEPYLDGAAPDRCFLVGSSAGGNIAYCAALSAGAGAGAGEISPAAAAAAAAAVVGLVMNQPYFGGVKRTESEARSGGDRIIPLAANDLMWRLALPEGADRDHVYSNPAAEEDDGGNFRRLPRCLVTGYGGDPLVDRQRMFVEMLRERGVDVVARFEDHGFHAVDLFDPAKANALYDVVADFVSSVITDIGAANKPKSSM